MSCIHECVADCTDLSGYGSVRNHPFCGCAGYSGRLASTLVGLPGTVLILLDSIIFSACHGFQHPPWWLLLILLVVSIIAETSDNLLSALGVKVGGGSTRTSLWALIGGVAGAIAGANFSPVLSLLGMTGGLAGVVFGAVLPPLILAAVGGFLASYICELRTGKEPAEARKAGWAALAGRLAGVLLKAVLASVMVGLVLSTAF